MIQVLIVAPTGHMGQLLIREVADRNDMELAGALGPTGRDYIGQDAGLVSGLGKELRALVYDDPKKIISRCDVLIDFSRTETSMEILKTALTYKKAFVCGTTGFSAEQRSLMKEASKQIPLLLAANTSYVVTVMQKLLVSAAEALKDKCTIDVVDLHSAKKVDAPSGTALEFGEAMKKAAGKEADENFLTYHSIRSGDIPSSHNVIFGCMGERIEITHHAYDYRCYAKGACDAAHFLVGKPAGLYGMEDL